MLSNRDNSTEFIIRFDNIEYKFNISSLFWFDELFENQEYRDFVNEVFPFSAVYLFDLTKLGKD